MTIITLSTAVFSGGMELAGCISNKLGYKMVSRAIMQHMLSFPVYPFVVTHPALSALRPGKEPHICCHSEAAPKNLGWR